MNSLEKLNDALEKEFVEVDNRSESINIGSPPTGKNKTSFNSGNIIEQENEHETDTFVLNF